MESIGEVLRSTREEKGYSIDQIARDTNIAKRYLIALEDEDFSAFPGETYLIGFLRTYSEHLDLDPNTTINLYKNLRIQEQPVPLEELLNPRPNRGKIVKIAAVVLVAAGLGVTAYFLIPKFLDGREERVQRVEADTSSVYQFTDEIVERRFIQGDIIEMAVEGQNYRIVLKEVGDSLLLDIPGSSVRLPLGQEEILDLDESGRGDVKVFLRDIDKAEKAVVLHLDTFIESTVTLSNRPGNTEELTKAEGAEGPPAVPQNTDGIPLGTPLVASRQVAPLVVLEAETPEPFTLDVVFRGYCLVRYMGDGGSREERYFHKGETFRLDVSREVRLWISNAGSFKAKIGGVDVDLGKPGEVAAKLIRWIPDETGNLHRLTVVQAY
ncbi:MAG: helix-turn-helix domain-containing protein [Spirochaetales bacterium]|nr:helix-turn-helix domain-containing protein [Spirochaetales bacterium]